MHDAPIPRDLAKGLCGVSYQKANLPIPYLGPCGKAKSCWSRLNGRILFRVFFLSAFFLAASYNATFAFGKRTLALRKELFD